jgi:putative addiction module component (TIGR02574 family)
MPLLDGSYLDTVLRMIRKKELLLDEALRLPEKDRADLAVKLIQSLDRNPDNDVDAIWAQEIERRCAAVDAGEAVTSDWEEVRSRIEREVFRR